MDTTLVKVTNIAELGGSSILGISIDTLVSAVIAMLVFGLGLFLTRRFDNAKRHDHLLEVEKYLYDKYSEISDSVVERITSFNILIEQLKKEEQGDISMTYVSDYSIEFIQEINWIDYYNVFSKLKGEDRDSSISIFKDINKCMAVIKDIGKLWRGSYDELVSRQLEYERRWNDNITTIGSITDDFVTTYKDDYIKGTDDFIDALDVVLHTYHETPGAPDLYVTKNALLGPLHELIHDNPTKSWGRRFLDPVMGCIYAYENYTKNRKAFEGQFNNYITKLEKADEKLKESVEELRQMENSKPTFWS